MRPGLLLQAEPELLQTQALLDARDAAAPTMTFIFCDACHTKADSAGLSEQIDGIRMSNPAPKLLYS